MNLKDKKCIPCEDKTVKPLTREEISPLLEQISGWELDSEAKKISCARMFSDFKEAMKFVNSIADIAETEGHHPDISISYNQVVLTLWTHSIGGLSENDFILAAKIDAVE